LGCESSTFLWWLVSPITMTSADFLAYRNTESSPRPPLVIAFPFRLFLLHLHIWPVYFGLCKEVLAYPIKYASYAPLWKLFSELPVRQYRLLQSRFLQCMSHLKPPCDLLILPDTTPAYLPSLPLWQASKGLAPSGKIMHENKEHLCIGNGGDYALFPLPLQQVCDMQNAHAGHTLLAALSQVCY